MTTPIVEYSSSDNDSIDVIFADFVSSRKNQDLDMDTNTDSTCCAEYFTHKIKTLSKSFLHKTKSISKLVSESIKNSKKSDEPPVIPKEKLKTENINMKMSEDYLRSIDFSNIESPSVQADSSGYFAKLFAADINVLQNE
eukprot:756405_1